MFSFLKNMSILKLSIFIYLFLIILLYFYNPYLFINNQLSKIAWLICILSIISFIIATKFF